MGALAVLALLALAACATPAPPSPCAGWAPIRPELGESARLSPELRAQILSHNTHGHSLNCWEP